MEPLVLPVQINSIFSWEEYLKQKNASKKID